MRRSFFLFCFLFCGLTSYSQQDYKADFIEYWNLINENFAYFHLQKTGWEKARRLYQPSADTINTRNDFIRLLERVNHELYNGHINLNTNLQSSNRLIPSGADIWLTYQNKRFIINSVREGYNADRAGLKKGMQVIGYNGLKIDSAVSILLPKSVASYDKRMYEYAVNTLLAGTHDTKRSITVYTNGKEHTYDPDSKGTNVGPQTLVESQLYPGQIGYIKINNSLGNTDLIRAFDSVLDQLESTKGLVLDLRETPGGGNTTVARAIMGRFIDRELPYQKHSIPGEETVYGVKRSWLELVTPRGKIYKKPLVILVNRWTGSMGEGIALGFDGMKRARITGDLMAGLLGANYSFTLTHSKIGFSFPGEQLFHVNGMPREKFQPFYFETDYAKQLKLALSLFKTSAR